VSLKLYDAARCPYCARVRIALAEKGLVPETIEIDLSDRPKWIYDLNQTGRVPVLDDDGLVLPESLVIMEYLDERYPDHPLLPAGSPERAQARLAVYRFDASLGDDYYAFRRGETNALLEKLAVLELGESHFVDIAYVPWVIRARDMLGVELPERLAGWLDRLAERHSIATEIAVVQNL
jgi:glutathione S-transferase